MRKFLSLFLTLRGRLILLICLATLPAILFTFYIAHNERNAALNRMEENARHIVNIISREHLYQMAGAKSLLRWLSQKLESDVSGTLISDPDFFAALLSGYPQLGNIALLSPNGEVINSAFPLPGPINMHDYDAIQRALQSQDIEVGSYVIGPIVKRPLLHLTHAVRDDLNQIRWIVFVAIDLEWLEKLIEKIELPTDHILLITDRKGKILSSSAPTGDMDFSIGQAIPAFTKLTQAKDMIISTVINDKALSFVTTSMEDIDGVFVATAIPNEQIYQKANHVFYRTLGLLGLLSLFTVISVLVVEELALLRAVRALSEATKKFGKGDFTARVLIPNSYGELHDMANAFNTMAETLAQRHQEITIAHHRLDRLSQHLQVARETEAQRISRDLHDEVGQVLTSIKMDLANFQSKCKRHHDSLETDNIIGESINTMRDKIDGTVDFIRHLASDLRPPVLDRIGIIPAITRLARNLEENTELIVDVETCDIPEPLDWLVSTTIYRITQEALTNISRHAQATEVHISLNCENETILLTIKDNGKGFDPTQPENETLGLIGMSERARLVGGDLTLESAAEDGTRIHVTIPVHQQKEAENEYPSS